MDNALKSQLRAQSLAEQLVAAVAQAKENPSLENRLAIAELAVTSLNTQLTTAISVLSEIQAKTFDLPLTVNTGRGRVLGSGVAFVGEDSLLSITLSDRVELDIRISYDTRLVLAAREEPYSVGIWHQGGCTVLSVKLEEVQRGGEVYARHTFPVVTGDGREEELSLDFSWASLGGNLHSPIRVCWSLSQVEAGRDE